MAKSVDLAILQGMGTRYGDDLEGMPGGHQPRHYDPITGKPIKTIPELLDDTRKYAENLKQRILKRK